MSSEQGLIQQGYDYSPAQLDELSWALRFTPTVCMLGAIVGLTMREPLIHFFLSGLGMLPFWFPRAHPVDLFYNGVLRPLWDGVRLPPNPLPRRIACFMGGAMNLGIGLAFTYDAPNVAYAMGVLLVGLQIIVITTHFCMASWMYEMFLRLIGKWTTPISCQKAKALLASGGELVDVRNPEEYAREHLPGARNIPLDRIVTTLTGAEERAYILYCQSGLRSQRAAQTLKRRGLGEIYNLGAMASWDEASEVRGVVEPRGTSGTA